LREVIIRAHFVGEESMAIDFTNPQNRDANSRQVYDQSNNSDGSVGVEHDSESGAHSAGREVLGELSADKAVVAVGFSDAAPDDSEFCVVSDALALENVSNSLAKVKASGSLLIHTLHLEECELLGLGALASLESDEHGLGVESIGNV
jgi:hypothetical protein